MCEAPMPFIVGVHRSFLPKIKHLEIEDETIIVDLDKNTCTNADVQDTAFLPDIKQLQFLLESQKLRIRSMCYSFLLIISTWIL